MAERALPSPVLINYDPGWIDDYSGWEYESDDYFDGDGFEESGAAAKPAKIQQAHRQEFVGHKRKRSHGNIVQRKRLKDSVSGLGKNHDTEADSSALQPLVVWKRDYLEQDVKVPLVQDGEGSKVGLLVDWRERLKVHLPRANKGKRVEDEEIDGFLSDADEKWEDST